MVHLASIYGAQAANGVVIITTKKGASGKIRVSINATTEFGDCKEGSGDVGPQWAQYRSA